MSSLTLRHYHVTLDYRTLRRNRRTQQLHQLLKINLSRRQLRRHLRSAIRVITFS